MDTQRILIDTSIAVEGGEAIIAQLEKIAPVFVTDIVLQELDGHKNNANGAVAFQARTLFKRLGKDNGVELHVIPLSNMPLEKGDTLRKMTLGDTPLHVIVRKFYKTKNINDSKIIEIAKDYNMTLVTLDMAQSVRAVSEGVDVEVLKVKENSPRKKLAIIIFGIGVFCIVFGILFAVISYLFGAKDSSMNGLLFGFPALASVLVASIIYPKINSKENYECPQNSEFMNMQNSNILSDSAYCSVPGNTYHSDE